MKASDLVKELNNAIENLGDLEVLCEEYKIIRVSENVEDVYLADGFGENYIMLEGIC